MVYICSKGIWQMYFLYLKIHTNIIQILIQKIISKTEYRVWYTVVGICDSIGFLTRNKK